MEKKKTAAPAKKKSYPKSKKPAKPMTKEDIAHSPDEKTDEDFPGFPHPPSQEETIRHRRK